MLFETLNEPWIIRSFGKLLVSGRVKHGLRPYSIPGFEQSDGREFDSLSLLSRNSIELDQFLASQGITQIEGLSSSVQLSFRGIRILIMAACMIVVLLNRWLFASRTVVSN